MKKDDIKNIGRPRIPDSKKRVSIHAKVCKKAKKVMIKLSKKDKSVSTSSIVRGYTEAGLKKDGHMK